MGLSRREPHIPRIQCHHHELQATLRRGLVVQKRHPLEVFLQSKVSPVTRNGGAQSMASQAPPPRSKSAASAKSAARGSGLRERSLRFSGESVLVVAAFNVVLLVVMFWVGF